MKLQDEARLNLSHQLIEAIRSFPVQHTVEHCDVNFSTSPFDVYAECPQCGTRIKIRSFSGVTEIEDVFDAVFEWMLNPAAQELVARRQQVIMADKDE